MDAEVNSACMEYEGRLEDYLSGQLSGADAKALADHLAQCGGCRAAVELAASGTRLLALAEPTPDPGSGFTPIAMARIRHEIAAEASRSFWQPFVAVAWRFAATVTVALALTLSYQAVQARRAPATETAIAQARINDMRYIFTTEQDRVPSSRDDVLIMVAETKNGNH